MTNEQMEILACAERGLANSAKEDFLSKIDILKKDSKELVGLLSALKKGRIDGSVYYGECSCFIGTIATIRDCDPWDIPGLEPNPSSPTEILFTNIKKGDTPENNIFSKTIVGWLEDRIQKELDKLTAKLPANDVYAAGEAS